MTSTLAIGDFSRATHLSVTTLRHYHEIGLLEPVVVDPSTGYRRYSPAQIGTAQVIRRFRDLDMPLDEIRSVLSAPNSEARSLQIATHLTRLEDGLTRTQQAVVSLRRLLEQSPDTAPIGHRSTPETPAAGISEVVDKSDALIWYQGAVGELRSMLTAQHLEPTGVAGAVFADELFAEDRGEATVFVPCASTVRRMGRVSPVVVPAVEMATVVHAGSHVGIDLAYGALGAYVARHAVGIGGPIREYYLVGPSDTDEESLWRTEVGWPIFETRPS